MKLDEYIQVTLEQIVTGVKAAQDRVVVHGAYINPQRRTVLSKDSTRFTEGLEIQDVRFDVVVTVSEDSDSGGQLRVGMPGIGSAGIGGRSAQQQTSENRIQFSVPLTLPPAPTRLKTTSVEV